jgi:hypothetical protein
MLPVLAVHVASLSLEMFWHLFLTKRSNRRQKKLHVRDQESFLFSCKRPIEARQFCILGNEKGWQNKQRK